MDPHTYDHKKLMMNPRWGDGGGRSMLLENMASSMDHHQHSHIFFHDQQSHHALDPSSLDHHSPVNWTSCSTNDTNYVLPFSHSNHIIPSPRPAYSAASLRFVGSNYTALPTSHHQVTLAHHHLLSQELHKEDEQGDKADEACYNKDLFVDVGLDHEEGEELSAMKEMMYKIAAMQPVDIDPSTIRKPKRRNVRISDDPQSMAARHRRERISEKMRILQRLVPGGTKMDTASMLDEAIRYVKFLKRQIKHLQQDQINPPLDDHQLLPASLKSSSLLDTTTSPFNHHQYVTVTMEANKQQLVRSSVAATPSHSNTTATTDNHNCCTFNSALTHYHHHQEGEKPLEILNICTSSNNKLHQCMDNINSVVMQTHLQMDIFSQQTSGFMDRR